MKPSHYRNKWIALSKTAVDKNALSQLAKQTPILLWTIIIETAIMIKTISI